jgi:hypothetical protein
MFAGILLKGEAGDIPGIIPFDANTSNPRKTSPANCTSRWLREQWRGDPHRITCPLLHQDLDEWSG